MKILIVGRGWVGNMMWRKLGANHSVEFCSHTECFGKLRSELDWVINCAGVTGKPNVDACEKDPIGTHLGNAVFPIRLADACTRLGIRLAHFSSGCIYEGTIDTLDAAPNFFGSVYSTSKGVSDTYLQDKAMVLRIRMPFNGEFVPKNFLYKVVAYSRNAKLWDGGLNSITNIDEATDMVRSMVEHDFPNGPYNLLNEGAITMHEIADLLNIQCEWFTDDDFTAATVAKRSNCVLPEYPKLSPVRESLFKAYNEMKVYV
jgi:dTDP-4-dehydrorhamnose reductase